MVRYHLVMIVRDEAERIEKCLESARRYCDTATIVDTGSTDDTVAICERYYPGQVSTSQWVNFGVNRSESLRLARGKGDWLLTLDADMTVEMDPDFEPDPRADAYDLRMGKDAFVWWLPLLLKGDLPWESVGAVHEYKRLPGRVYNSAATDKVRVTYTDKSSPAKTRWQADLLRGELERNPDEPRSTFYLAQCLRELGENDEARRLYYRRAGMKDGYIEEAFYAAFRAALLEPHWEDRVIGLIAAWEMRPHRLEPLYELVWGLNQRKKHHMAYWLSSVPIVPTTDRLFVHQNIWDYGMTFERSIAAWYVGRQDECRALCDELLANPRLPDNLRQQVITNRGFCKAA